MTAFNHKQSMWKHRTYLSVKSTYTALIYNNSSVSMQSSRRRDFYAVSNHACTISRIPSCGLACRGAEHVCDVAPAVIPDFHPTAEVRLNVSRSRSPGRKMPDECFPYRTMASASGRLMTYRYSTPAVMTSESVSCGRISIVGPGLPPSASSVTTCIVTHCAVSFASSKSTSYGRVHVGDMRRGVSRRTFSCGELFKYPLLNPHGRLLPYTHAFILPAQGTVKYHILRLGSHDE